MIGDSTMADKPNPESNPERGWGQMLPSFFNENVVVVNHAVNGRSTRSFIGENRWDTVMKAVKPGDYVFIQFGHNDQKIKDPKRYTNPYTGYRENLVKFVMESREAGAIPVLFSSTVRRKYNEYGVLIDTHGEYPFVVREVAESLDVPFIDLQLRSERLVISAGEEASKAIYLWIKPGEYEMYPNGREDNTHFSSRGAAEIARLAVEGIKEEKLELVKYLVENEN
jgi:lysophospholipase L1-like esterase